MATHREKAKGFKALGGSGLVVDGKVLSKEEAKGLIRKVRGGG